jgi:hypothetical protein
MRELLSRTGHADLSRLDNHQVRKAARAFANSGAILYSLSDIRTVLAFLSEAGIRDHIGLRQLFDRAIPLLDFKVEPHKGLLYAGQYATYLDLRTPPDDRLTEEIRAAAPLPSGAADKTTIAHTPGGRWLLPWNLRYLLGDSGEDAVWAHATGRFVDRLIGQVEVLLPFRDFNFVMTRLPWHPLFEVPDVTTVFYYLDDDPKRLFNPPKELFGPGLVKRAHGKTLVFQAQK